MTGQTAALGLALGTQSQNLLFDEFLGVVRTAQQNRTTGNAAGGAASAKFPQRQREARDCHWDRRDARTIEGKALLLSLAKTSDNRNKSGLKRQPPLVIPLKTVIPKNCTAITVHYDVLDRAFYLLFKIKVAQVKETQASGAMGIDLGQIRHAACITEVEGHRDAVGAWNILAKWYVSTNGHRPAFRQDIVATATQKYHVPVGVKGVRRSPVPRKFQPFTCSAEQPRSGPIGFEARPRQTPAGRGTSPSRDSVKSRQAKVF